MLNEYLTLIERQNAAVPQRPRRHHAGVLPAGGGAARQDLDAQSARILEFKSENAEALPENLQNRLSQQARMEEELRRIDRDIAGLRNQSERLVQLFEATGQAGRRTT